MKKLTFRVPATLIVILLSLSQAAIAQTRGELFSYQDLKVLLNKKPRTIQSLLAQIPFWFRQDVVYMTDSGSLQAAEFNLPRAIMYGAGDLVITYNGAPSQEGFEALEIVHYDWNQHEFIFEEFVADDDLAARKLFIQNRIANGDQNFSLADLDRLNDRHDRTGLNPPLCLQCHESGAHPLLPAYPQGEGLFGGYFPNDQLADDSRSSLKKSLSENDRYRLGALPLELSGADATGDRQREFNNLLTARNWDRVAALIRQSPSFEKFKITLLKALAGCEMSDLSVRLPKVRFIVENLLGLSMKENFATDNLFGSYAFLSPNGGIENLLPPLIDQMRTADGNRTPTTIPAATFCSRLLHETR